MKKLSLPSRLFLGTALACATLRAGAVESGTADMAELETLLNQPVYAASKFAQAAADAPASVTVLTAGDIRAYGWRTIGEVLNAVRGVHLRYDRFYHYAGVRGFARPGDFSSRLLMLIDGMRVNDNIYDQAGAGLEFPLDVALIDRVEFIPGPGSALYGSNAVLGVVNIVTRSGAALLGTSGEIALGPDSARMARISVAREFGDAQLALAARSEVRPGGALSFPEYAAAPGGGSVSGADRETDRKLFARWSEGAVSATGIVSERRKQIPTGAFSTVFPSLATSGTDRYAFADVQWQPAAQDGRQWFARASLGQYDFRGRFDYPEPDGLQHLDQTGQWLAVEARWLATLADIHRLVLGVEVQDNLRQRQRSSFDGTGGGVGADIDERSWRTGVFVSDEIALRPNLHATLGLRADRQLGARKTATPRFALVWEASPGLVAKLLDGRAYREPNAYESQYQDITSRLNPDLRSETLHATEAALDWHVSTQLRLSASVYRYRVANLIEQQSDPDTGLLVFNNAGLVRSRGLELEADYVSADGWRARTSWAGQRTREGGSDAPLSNAPNSLTKLHVSLPLATLQARAGIEWQRVGERLTLAGDRLPPYALTNVTLQYLPPGSPLNVSVSVYNLFDKAYADPGGPELLQDRIAQDGRQWRVQLGVQF